jgi:hypothetical protein
MSASSTHYHGSTLTGLSTRSAFLSHLNTNTLAVVLFVALAILGTTRGKEPQNNESAYARDTESRLAIRPCDTSPLALQEVYGHEFSTGKDFGNKVAPNQ